MPNKRKHGLPDELMVCRVCGLRHDTPPWGYDGHSPSFEICPCCGTEFGYDDTTRAGVLRRRAIWRETDFKWTEPAFCPSGWDKAAQMEQIPADYLDDHA